MQQARSSQFLQLWKYAPILTGLNAAQLDCGEYNVSTFMHLSLYTKPLHSRHNGLMHNGHMMHANVQD